MRKIELLAPARTADVGIEAFNHGADAVYIGAPAFSARAAAGNSVQEIERLANYGHQYGASTIVALNTILSDSELPQAERLAWQLYEAGVDALIIQDFGLLQLNLPPIELHASTQMDNRTAEKTRLLRDLGMTRVVLARELGIDQIKAIHEAVPEVELECFIHGALCVCFSGQCYMSAALTGRSANRGECAQPCRLPMDLYSGDVLQAKQKHLLSLRDMNRSAYIEQMIAAGVTSLKIEGRLKDVTYVKNVVAYYRQLLDATYDRQQSSLMTEADHKWRPASMGRCTYSFQPALEKSFNRGFTSYFAEGKREPMWNFESPKAMGERVGTVDQITRDHFTIRFDQSGKSLIELHNGDGLSVGAMGFRLNRYDKDTRSCFPLDGQKVCQQLRRGQVVWRNLDMMFEQQLLKPSAKRQIPIEMSFSATPDLLTLSAHCSENNTIHAEVTLAGNYPAAQKEQGSNFEKQLQKLGDTPFVAQKLAYTGENLFVPSSILSEIRRKLCVELSEACLKVQSTLRTAFCAPDYASNATKLDAKGILPSDYLANLMNREAHKTYSQMQIGNTSDAFELQKNKQGKVMQTKHCLKYAFGQCPRYPNPHPEQLMHPELKLGNEATLKIGNKKFILKFGCKNDCISEIFTTFAANQ